ncbi:hypothetical protein F5Y09DRAFT_3403 [Xylaria sp. FL1042]|nr:hypothetical protein F5Y09DRAFT_740 [Xylaria sp. FL1042]KAI0435404.1 hypothetical protein F5Y09DRAFT_3403 [Xylaria sp. FL1042]
MPLRKLDVLVSEIERQIAITSNLSRQGSFGLNYVVQTRLFEDQDHSDYRELKDWCETLSQSDKTEWEDIAIPPNCQRCLWKLLALGNSSSPIINPGYQQARCRYIQGVHRRGGLDGSYTEDIWQAASLRSWVTSQESSVAVIQGTSQTIRCLEQFSCEISRQLGEIYPTIWMLSEPSSREFFSTKDETEILRQLAIQAIRQISHFKGSFIIDSLLLFKECSTSEDWFHILKTIFQLIPKVYVVIDLNILGARINHAKNWPNDFQALISQLSSSCSSKLAVMLLSSRLLLRGDPSILVIPMTSQSRQVPQPEPRKASFEPSPTNYIRYVSTLVSMDKRHCDQADHNAISALAGEHIGPDPIATSSARCDSLHNVGILQASSSSRHGNEEAPRDVFNSIVSGASLPSLPLRNEIPIAIICALPLEADAVLAVFDHHWDIQLFGNMEGDKNAYSVGRIGCHNVVLVHMPGMGRTPAATVATSCRTSFPGISLALVVGICGAVPFGRHSTEIVLGDVVISDRLVVYDFGRQFPDKFMRKEETHDSARKPPEEIRNFLSKIKVRMRQTILQNRTGSHLEALIRSGYPPYPGVHEDRLFEPSYRHRHQRPSECAHCTSSEPLNGSVCDIARISTCDVLGCDLRKLVARQRHSLIVSGVRSWLPGIHFGAYASGDRVMKSGEHRDEIADREEVIAFEMEGAGVWEIFPCIIIKGVCDYADSHKNKKWQGYAAVTAAACLKAFLEVWPTRVSTSNSIHNS